jgi:hypothetical protein
VHVRKAFREDGRFKRDRTDKAIMIQAKRDRFRFCKTKSCRALFRVSNLSSSYCEACVRKRQADRRAKRAAGRRDLDGYPKGFTKRRKQIALIDDQCVCCLTSTAEHRKKYHSDLEQHHVIFARMAQQFGDPHAAENLAPTCVTCHSQLKNADIALIRNDWLEWVAASKRAGLPDAILKRALDFYGIGWQRLPL